MKCIRRVSVVCARDRARYIRGLTAYREGEIDAWIEQFAVATMRAVDLAEDYLRGVDDLLARWRATLRANANSRSDAAAWAIIDVLPQHPVVTAAVAGAATGRAKAAVHAGRDQLAGAGVLLPLSQGRRNRSWEAVGLLDLIADLESGKRPCHRCPQPPGHRGPTAADQQPYFAGTDAEGMAP